MTELVALVLLVAACGSPSADPPTTTSAAADERAGVLVAAAVERARYDDGWDGVRFARFGVIHHLGCPAGEGHVTQEACAQFTDAERAMIEAALAPTPVQWVDSWSEMLPDPPSNTVPTEVVAVLTFAVPEIDGDDAVIVSAILCGSLCGTGGAHTLHRGPDGVWRVTGTTGPQWES